MGSLLFFVKCENAKGIGGECKNKRELKRIELLFLSCECFQESQQQGIGGATVETYEDRNLLTDQSEVGDKKTLQGYFIISDIVHM